ncbi:MAG: thylakoid-associated protein [Hydrococcus sp. C42_A2020_068]|uniref:Thylakoid-associated protein n=1 Tax=Hydrococcus rivularis NIES-593 TaxID=1921803 RepID=A0A1U7HNV0_9CYAN|nr:MULTISPECIES: hypothetical protein [Pleurocapsales]AFY79165.1 hypothetical protein Ple7327_4022 [Pleurocapsa sp. PCC 7327]MBF2020722.1 thylakoid-associated protein [Hydrococcus sp. C42_A2020_068]OKH25228.1 thylakoid-associated protein [Hydrococcus rivularis NIES-593]
MDTKIWEEYQKQFSEWQKKFIDTWLESLPNGKNALNFGENFEKTLKFQEEIVRSYLEVQEKTTQMLIETQKQFWSDYFETMRKTPATTSG